MEVSMRFFEWRENFMCEMSEINEVRRIKLFQAESEDQQRSMAVCNLRSVMWRIAKGRVAMYVEQWCGHMKRDMLLRGDAMRVRLEAEMKAGRKAAATSQLRWMIVRMIKGEITMRIQVWKRNMQYEAKASCAALIFKVDTKPNPNTNWRL